MKSVILSSMRRKKRKYHQPISSNEESQTQAVTGILRVHPKGFGFLQTTGQAPYLKDIFIPKHLTHHAVDGDLVEVKVDPERFTEKGPEGRVVTILKRSRSHLAGIIRMIDRSGQTIAYVPLLGSKKRVLIETGGEKLSIGDRVVLEVLEWGSESAETLCRVSDRIGHISDPSCDILAAVEEYGLRLDFPQPVLEEIKQFGKQVPATEIKHREDLRDLECLTIDPTTAKDFDDAVSITKHQNGYQLGVHIADVSHYVVPGTAIDEEAARRSNSTYFPGFCVPMLPPELSDNLCSLKPNVNRLTVTVFMDFDVHGNLIHNRIVRSIIKSKKRFTYRQAKEVLDGTEESPHKKTLQWMVELCQLLKKQRYERGSIEFVLSELVVLVDNQGNATGTDYIEYDITHQMIEEFMLKTNEVIAKHLDSIGKNLTYRIHDEPAEENLKEFSDLARAFGFTLTKQPTTQDLQKLFDKALETPIGPYLAAGFIRRMRLASYSPNNIGHYGLALTHYCHFTSPIRRYIDLVIHRILFGEDDDFSRLERIALFCSEQERLSARAENSVVLLKKLRLLSKMVQSDPYKSFSAVVTKVKKTGFFFEVLNLMVEGFFHVADLETDYFIFEERGMRLRGTSTQTAFFPGKQIEVKLKSIDLIMMETRWELISEEIHSKKFPKKQKKRKPKH